MNLSWDSNNGIIVSLNHTSNSCRGRDCDSYKGKIYTLSLVRVQNDTRAALQLEKPKSAKGKTAAVAEITKYNDGSFETAFMNDGKITYAHPELPKALSINYIVKRKFQISRKKMKVSCQFALK